MQRSPRRVERRRSLSPRRGGGVPSAIAAAMTGEWRASGHSVGTDSSVQEELEDFTLHVHKDGYLTGCPTYELDLGPEDIFRLTGSVQADSRGLGVEIRQVYPHTKGVTHWTARVENNGTTLSQGKWSGSCSGSFRAERLIQGGARPQPEPEPQAEYSRASPTQSSVSEWNEKREQVLWELAKSEDKYSEDLQTLMVYRAELKKQLPRADLDSLFHGIDDIAALNFKFNNDLNDALGECHDANEALAVRHGGICSLFLDLVPKMTCYQGYVEALSNSDTLKIVARPEVSDTVARVAARRKTQTFDVLRMAPVRRLESYKACFARLLQFTARRAPEYVDLNEINHALHVAIVRDISPRNPGSTDLQEVRRAQRDRAERSARGASVSYNDEPTVGGGGSTLDRITRQRQKERDLHRQAQQRLAAESRVQRRQQLELQRVVDEVVGMGYDRDLVEKVQLVEKHASPIPLIHAVMSESPKHRQAPAPRFIGIANPSNYGFVNATIQCLRHTPHLVANLMELAVPAGDNGSAATLIGAFVALLKRMDRDYGTGVPENSPARHDFLQACSRLLPAQAGEETHDWFWSWEDDDGSFYEYDARSAEVIERAYQLKHDDVLLKLAPRGRPAEYRIENLLGKRDGRCFQVNTATGMARLVKRRERRFTAEPTRMVETDWRQQQQQDAGEFLHLLLDQFSMDKGSDGSAILGRMLTKPRESVSRSVADALTERLNRAVRLQRTEEENELLKQFADEQWGSSADTTRRTAIGKFFQGQTLQLKKCLNCQQYSPCTADPFIIDQLNLHSMVTGTRASLEQLLQNVSDPQRPADYRCDLCQEIGSTNILSALVRLPRIYIVWLNRDNTTALGSESRVATSIDFPDEMNLAGTGAHCGLILSLAATRTSGPIRIQGSSASLSFQTIGY